jgi:hypothetical protein
MPVKSSGVQMNIPLIPAVRRQMERDLTDIAKDMQHGDEPRLMTLRNGSWHGKVAMKFTGIEDDNGMPVASSDVLRHLRDDLYTPYAAMKLFYDVDRHHVTKSPGKKAFSGIIFDPPPKRGFQLARAITKWVDDWMPIHQHCLMVGNGDAFAGAKRSERAKDKFVRTSTVIDLREYGFPGTDPVLARLMLSPILSKPSLVDTELALDRVFSLHRTMPEGSVAAEVLQQAEEELLVGTTVAWDKGGQSFTAFDAIFGNLSDTLITPPNFSEH